MKFSLILFALLAGSAVAARAETVVLAPVQVTDWKAVYGRIEARDRVPARARIGAVLRCTESPYFWLIFIRVMKCSCS